MKYQQGLPMARELTFLLFVSCAVSILNAQESDSVALETKEAIKSLSNSDIDWGGFGFAGAGPGIVDANAKRIEELDVKVAKDLIESVQKPDSFIVAHVLLTRAWRIPRKDKEWIILPISNGFVVAYNGLIAKIEWKDVSGQATKTVTIPDEDHQQKRIAFWWKSRYRDFPSEFSPKTRVD